MMPHRPAGVSLSTGRQTDRQSDTCCIITHPIRVSITRLDSGARLAKRVEADAAAGRMRLRLVAPAAEVELADFLHLTRSPAR